jgi:hypothetical protein
MTLSFDKVMELAALSKGPVFLNAALQQIHPQEGQVFCEVDTEVDYEGAGQVIYGSLVEYLGEEDVAIFSAEHGVEHGLQHRVVCVDYADSTPEDRTPRGMVLILQH